MKKAQFIVELDLPTGVKWSEMAACIRNEVQALPGHFPPEDPIYDLDRQSVVVKQARTRKAP